MIAKNVAGPRHRVGDDGPREDRLGSAIRTQATNGKPRVSSEPLAVCDGTVFVGSIVERRAKYLAYDAADQIIGTFTTLSGAMRAIPTVRR